MFAMLEPQDPLERILPQPAYVLNSLVAVPDPQDPTDPASEGLDVSRDRRIPPQLVAVLDPQDPQDPCWTHRIQRIPLQLACLEESESSDPIYAGGNAGPTGHCLTWWPC